MKRLKYFFSIGSFILAISCARNNTPDPNGNLSAPVVDFSASQTSVYAGTSINFTDLSTESPTSWSWTFQGGTPSNSTDKNPANILYNTPGTYTVTLTASNAAGHNVKTKTGYIVVTDSTLPLITTSGISMITVFSANSGGYIARQGASSVIARGVCWSNTPRPTIINSKTVDGSGIGSFISSLSGLTPNTQYYVRAYATNSNGTSYGNEASFTTSGDCGTVTDIDGNVYHTVTIGSQCWMVENLKTSKYNDGTIMLTGLSDTSWAHTNLGAYSYYNNDVNNNSVYGKLYNWYAVNTGKLAPNGWRIPTKADYDTLFFYLGGRGMAGIKLKSTNLWLSLPGNNYSGFTWVPGGGRSWDGSWWASTLGSVGMYYTSESSPFFYFLVSGGDNNIYSSTSLGTPSPNVAISVRCVKN